ncbi:hypothetical protein B0T10DRAFT_366234, partial [Thelonectria olida]
GISSILRRISPMQDRWPNPELSIGEYLGRIDRTNFWEAKGPAREAFNELGPDIKDYLERTLEPVSTPWVTWSMYMCGVDQRKVAPTIMFCCEVASLRQDVRNAIRNSGLLDSYRGMKTGHMATAPRFNQLMPLGDEYSLEFSWATHPLVIHHVSPVEGVAGSRISVGLYTDTEPAWRKATIGGIIQVKEKYYYTTVAHVFETVHEETGDSNTFPVDDNQYVEIDSDDVGDDELETHRSPHARHHRQEPEQDRYRRQDPEREIPRSATRPTRSTLQRILPPPFIMSLDEPHSDLDYALIEAKDPDHQMANVLKHFTVHDEDLPMEIDHIIKLGQEDKEIVAISVRGPVPGRMSGTPVYARAPGSRVFEELYSVQLSGPVEVGDSGAWILDRESQSWCGYIVAGSPGSGAALVVPSYHLFEDIERRMGIRPSLPSSS